MRLRPNWRTLSVSLGAAMFGLVPGITWAQAPTAAPAASATPPEPSPPGAPSAPEASPVAPADAPALVPPTLLRDVQPQYPEAAQKENISAAVVLELELDTEGHVARASVAEPAQPQGYGFDEAALAAAKSLEFTPASEGGKPVPVVITFRFRFVPQVPVETTPTPTQSPTSAAEPPTAPTKAPAPQPMGELWGRLLERGTRLPLTGIKVTAFRGEGEAAEGFETETDSEGRFKLNDLGIGEWRLLADPDGYYPLRTTETVTKGLRTEVSYAIERNSYNPYDVLVDTKRVQREVSQVTIDARQAERIPGTFGDVLAVVQNFPGVAQTPNGGPFDSGFVIRGAAPEDSRIFISNVDVPVLYHFGNLRSVLPVGMLEKVNFYPGNFSVQYGRAIGGVVDVDLKDLNRQQLGGYVDLNFFDSSLFLEAPVTEDLSIAIAGRRSYIDVLLGAILPNTGASVIAPRYYDAQLLATYRPTPEHQLKTFFFLSDDKFEVVFENPVAADAQTAITDFGLGVNFYRGIAEYKYVPTSRFENELKVSFGRDLRGFNLGQLLRIDNELYQGQLRNTSRYAFSDELALRGGVDYVYQYRDSQTKLPTFSEEGDGGNTQFDAGAAVETSQVGTFHSLGGFTELEWRPWQGMLAIPGVRLDYFGRTGEWAAAPRVVLRQNLSDEWVIKGGVGLYQQEPIFEETMPNTGNPDLGLERAIHYSAGFEYQPLRHLNLNVTGFYKTLDDLVGPTDAVTTKNGATVPLNYDNGAEGRVIGLEVSAKHELNKNLFAWVAYTLSKSERKDAGETGHRLFDYDQTHILTVTGSYRLPKNWEIGTRFRYISGKPYTPVVGAVLNADTDQYEPRSGALNSARVDDFHQLDFRIDKRWVYEDWMLNAYLDIQNVYNHINVQNIEYNYDYSEQVPEQGIPIVPVFGLRGEF